MNNYMNFSDLKSCAIVLEMAIVVMLTVEEVT
jgi:hypothetical protein